MAARSSIDVAIVGSGLAGLSAAIHLAEAGQKVAVFESRPVLGGRTSSWTERGMEVESGLHRYLGFYRLVPRLIRKAGLRVRDVVTWEDEIEIRTPDGGPSGVFGTAPLHRPLTTVGGAIGNMNLVGPLEKAGLTRFVLAGLRDVLVGPAKLDQMSARDYALSHGVSEEVIQRLIQPLTAGVLFLPPEEFSAFGVFCPLAAAIPNMHHMRIGAFRGGMTQVLIQPLVEYIERLGGTVESGAPVSRLLLRDGRVEGLEIEGEEIHARHVILAAGVGAARRLIDAALPEERWFDGLRRLKTIPSVNLQFEADEPMMPIDRATFGAQSALSCFSEQSRTTFTHVPGRVSIILYPSQKYLEMDDDQIFKEVSCEAERLGCPFPAVRAYRVTRQVDDHYSIVPGSETNRPGQRTPVPGLSLAGDFTRQRFLISMEGAAVSGKRAARSAMEEL